MVDQLGIRRRAERRLRRGPGRTADPIAEDRRHAPADAGSALAIVHTRYDRELTRAATGDRAERARALAEARRLVSVAVALRHAWQNSTSIGSHASRPSVQNPASTIRNAILHERVSV